MAEKKKGFTLDDTKIPHIPLMEKLPLKEKAKPKKQEKPKKSGK